MRIDRELKAPHVRANPYPFYARLRKTAPVVEGAHPILGPAYYLTRYEDVYNALKDPRFVNDRANAVEGGGALFDRWWMPRILKLFQKNMVSQDEPNHRRLRNLVHKAFTPRMIENLTARVEQMVGEMLDTASRKPTADLIAELALPLPLNVISEMLGVPPPQRLEFRRMLSRFLESTQSPVGFLLSYPSAVGMERFFRGMVKLRREQPADDLMTALVQAEEAGDQLDEDELISMIFLLLFAGYETTVNLIGNGTLALLENPEQLQKLREHPELIDSAVEELLRYTNPVEMPGPRFAREDVEIQGVKIPRGSTVFPLLASANRDEAAFENPDTLDITRNPNRHVAFGYGIHYCLGAPLARLEGRIALQTLVQRFPEMQLAVPSDKLRWSKNPGLRGLKALPLHLSGTGARPNELPATSAAA
ncbi:cytochrome P450 [Archangium sp.]|uniref:cytochrome P450 family protein n=1 Tax=Archangium sp. TaxID=1872627 RepID=UPI002D6E9E10|nr:cytochrome P450 [Archangium sp.]HYO54519.1 cytochrome P450 [Archangium sp.]